MTKAINEVRRIINNSTKPFSSSDMIVVAIFDLADAVRSIDTSGFEALEASINDLNQSLETVLGEVSSNISDIELKV